MTCSEDLTEIEGAINEMEDEELDTYMEDIGEKAEDDLMRRQVRRVMVVSGVPVESHRATPNVNGEPRKHSIMPQDSLAALVEANRTLAQDMLDDSSDSDGDERAALRNIIAESQPARFPFLQAQHLPTDSRQLGEGAGPSMPSPYASSLKPDPTIYASPKAKERSSILRDREQSVAEPYRYWRFGRLM